MCEKCVVEIRICFILFRLQVLCMDTVCSLLRHQFIMWPWDVTQAENKAKVRSILMDDKSYLSRLITITISW